MTWRSNSLIGLIVLIVLLLAQRYSSIPEGSLFEQRMLVPTDSVMVSQHNVAGLADSLVYYVTQDSVIVATGLVPTSGFLSFDAIGGGEFHVRSGVVGGFEYEYEVCVGPERAGEVLWIFYHRGSPCGSDYFGSGVRTVGADGCFMVDINPDDVPYMQFYIVAVNDIWTWASFWRVQR